jgi:hypothetical protein
MQVISNLEESVAAHEWEIIINAYFEESFSASWKANDRWTTLEWMADVFYKDDKPAKPADCVELANSITSFKHFLSEIKVYEDPLCEFLVKVKGVRIIEFKPGKKYIPIEISFCKRQTAWLIRYP